MTSHLHGRSTRGAHGVGPAARRDRRAAGAGVVALVLAVSVVLMGCSSSDDAGASSATTATSADATSTTAAPEGGRGSEGCGKAPEVEGPAKDAPHDEPLTFESGGKDRTYRLAIPAEYDEDEPAPLVLNLHGSGSSAAQSSVYTQMPGKAGKRGYITVAPDAINGVWEFGADGADDDFLDALVSSVAADYCVDPDRVHVAGISLGAWKAGLVACNHADRYASVGLVAEEVHPDGCPPMPMVAFHGTADHIVPYGEGADPGVVVTGANAGLPGATGNVANWAEAAGCADHKDVEHIGDDVELWSYEGCDQGLDVHFYTVKGGDHTWPGSDITIGPTTKTIDATELILDFFDAHPHRR